MTYDFRKHGRDSLFLRSAIWAWVLLICCLRVASAHEIESTRLNLVQREPSHISATFYVPLVDYFQPVLDQPIPQQMFYVHLASMNDETFANLNSKAEAFYRQKIAFKMNKDKLVQLSQWQFSNWQSIRKNIQQQLAHQLMTPSSHVHFDPVQLTVQLTGSPDLSMLQPNLPSHWGKVLVIASKPQQIWLNSSQSPTWIKF